MPSHARYLRVAQRLAHIGITPAQMAAYVAAQYPSYREWAVRCGGPLLMSMEHVAERIQGWLRAQPPPEPPPAYPEQYRAPTLREREGEHWDSLVQAAKGDPVVIARSERRYEENRACYLAIYERDLAAWQKRTGGSVGTTAPASTEMPA
jgi:hypothetical protein